MTFRRIPRGKPAHEITFPPGFPAHGSDSVTSPPRHSFLVPCCCHLLITMVCIIVPLTEDKMIFRKVKQFVQGHTASDRLGDLLTKPRSLPAVLRQPALLVPVLLWLLWLHHDRLLADDILQPLLHVPATHHLRSP